MKMNEVSIEWNQSPSSFPVLGVRSRRGEWDRSGREASPKQTRSLPSSTNHSPNVTRRLATNNNDASSTGSNSSKRQEIQKKLSMVDDRLNHLKRQESLRKLALQMEKIKMMEEDRHRSTCSLSAMDQKTKHKEDEDDNQDTGAGCVHCIRKDRIISRQRKEIESLRQQLIDLVKQQEQLQEMGGKTDIPTQIVFSPTSQEEEEEEPAAPKTASRGEDDASALSEPPAPARAMAKTIKPAPNRSGDFEKFSPKTPHARETLSAATAKRDVATGLHQKTASLSVLQDDSNDTTRTPTTCTTTTSTVDDQQQQQHQQQQEQHDLSREPRSRRPSTPRQAAPVAPATKRVWVEDMEWKLQEYRVGWYTGHVVTVRQQQLPDGPKGTLRFVNGDVYQGPFRQGEMHGQGGMYMWANGGDIYEGDFNHNLRHGKGQHFLKGHILQYVGSYENGKAHGHGIQYRSDGATVLYQGKWHQGRPVSMPPSTSIGNAMQKKSKMRSSASVGSVHSDMVRRGGHHERRRRHGGSKSVDLERTSSDRSCVSAFSPLDHRQHHSTQSLQHNAYFSNMKQQQQHGFQQQQHGYGGNYYFNASFEAPGNGSSAPRYRGMRNERHSYY